MESFYGGHQGVSFVIVKRYQDIDSMCEEFAKGGSTTDEVNYGEYVIIDSLVKNDSDNGKVFRRGMNYTQTSESVSKAWATRYAEIFNSKIEESNTDKDLINLYTTNANLISNFLLDWDEYFNDFNTNSDSQKQELSNFLKSKYDGLLKKVSESYEFIFTNGYIIKENNTAISGLVEKFRTVYETYNELNEIIEWEHKKYCAYAGAEYIGQIIGPQGESALVKIDSYENIRKLITTKMENPPSNYKVGEDGYEDYDVTTLDIIPGKTEDDDEEIFNDNIKYAWVTLRDDQNNITGCKIGFKFPYLVVEYNAYSISPYNKETDEYYPSDSKVKATYNEDEQRWEYENLIMENDGDEVDEDGNIITTHPYYQHHDIYIPTGIRGDGWTNLRVITPSSEEVILDWLTQKQYEGFEDDVDNSRQIVVADYYNYLKEADPAPITYYIGDYNIISSVNIDFTTFNLTTAMKQEAAELERVSNSGTIQIDFTHNDSLIQKNALRWVAAMSLASNGKITWYDNKGDKYNISGDQLGWLVDVDVLDDGTIRYYWNHAMSGGTITTINAKDDKGNDIYYTEEAKKFKFIKSAYVDNGDTEGEGDQCLHVVYNDDEDVIISNPINYIIESVITQANLDIIDATSGESVSTKTNVPENHLFIYFSDKAYREKLKEEEKTYRYYSYKLEGWKDNWYDAGEVQGSASGLRILTSVSSVDDLPINGPGTDTDEDGNPLFTNPEQYYGWSYSVITGNEEDGSLATDIYVYDYTQKTWNKITSVQSQTLIGAPSLISESKPEDETLMDYGIWFVLEDAYYGGV